MVKNTKTDAQKKVWDGIFGIQAYQQRDYYGITGFVLNELRTRVDFDTADWVNDKDYVDKNAGQRTLKVTATVVPHSSSADEASPWRGRSSGTVTQDITFEVTSNTFNKDNEHKNNNAVDGATGYIVIPRGIELKSNGKQLTATPKVYMAGYQTSKQYTVWVDNVITIKNGDAKRDMKVYSGDNVTTIDAKGIVTRLGDIDSSQTKDNPLTFNMTTKETNLTSKINVKARWTGSINFYFGQVAGTGND